MKKIILPLLSVLLLASCVTINNPGSSSDNISNTTYAPDIPGTNFGDVIPDELNAYTYLDFFSHSEDVTFNFNFKNDVLKALNDYQSDASSSKYYDLYFPADLSIGFKGMNIEYKNIGVRIKGNTSRKAFYEDNSFGVFHMKISFKECFDDEIFKERNDLKNYFVDYTNNQDLYNYRKNRNFLGLEKLDVKYIPRNDSKTYAQEVYVYDSFRSEGLAAPYINVIKVNVKGEKYTSSYVAEVIETVDKEFLKRRFSKADAKGDLYKCTWGVMGPADLSKNNTVNSTTDDSGYYNGARIAKGRIGVEDNYSNYHPSYDLKTNDKNGEQSDFSNMANYVNAISNILNKNANKDYLESYLDVDQFLKFAAVSQLFGNPDDQRYNANNYYIYFLPSTKKAVYIPYDWDWCLGNSYQNGMENEGAFSEKYFSNNGMNRVYGATIFYNGSAFENKAYKETYLNHIKDAINHGILDFDNYKKLTDTLINVDGTENDTVSSYMNSKKNVLLNDINKGV